MIVLTVTLTLMQRVQNMSAAFTFLLPLFSKLQMQTLNVNVSGPKMITLTQTYEHWISQNSVFKNGLGLIHSFAIFVTDVRTLFCQFAQIRKHYSPLNQAKVG